jgi:hypothetical protein
LRARSVCGEQSPDGTCRRLRSRARVGAPLTGTLRVGSAVRDKPVVYFASDGGLSFDALPGTRGLLGNALLADQFVLIIDLTRSRIGLV